MSDSCSNCRMSKLECTYNGSGSRVCAYPALQYVSLRERDRSVAYPEGIEDYTLPSIRGLIIYSYVVSLESRLERMETLLRKVTCSTGRSLYPLIFSSIGLP
jgi:hypothetical protein